MEQRYLIDTNILIYYTKNLIPFPHLSAVEDIFVHSFNISVITRIEFLGWKNLTDQEFNQINKFIQPANVLHLTDEIVDQTILIKRKHQLKLPDAVILSTCIVHDLYLVTRNESDFFKLGFTHIYNPFK